MFKEWKDIDGDRNIGLEIGQYVVFAIDQGKNLWSINFALKSDILGNTGCWFETLTGLGAFRTIAVIKPAIIELISYLESNNLDWVCYCDKRRAKLYSRYLPSHKITNT